MGYIYRTHYKPNPCGNVGFKSEESDEEDDVNCFWCRAKNGIFPIKVEVR